MSLQTVNPATGETIQIYQEMSDEALAATIKNAHQAFLEWSQQSFKDRSQLMRNRKVRPDL